MKGMLKWPLILAAIAVVLRVVLEQSGAPNSISNLSSVVMLYLILCPLYFAIRIARAGVPHPYRTLFKFVGLYAILARAMVIPTYWLAYAYNWTAPRFSVNNGGNVGPDVTPIMGYVVIPLVALAAWVIASLLIGGGLGSALMALRRKSTPALSQ